MSELSEAEREALEDSAGCGCCSSKTSAELLFPDDCPKEDGYVDHDYRAGCIQMASVGDIAQRILTARLVAVEALHVEGEPFFHPGGPSRRCAAGCWTWPCPTRVALDPTPAVAEGERVAGEVGL